MIHLKIRSVTHIELLRIIATVIVIGIVLYLRFKGILGGDDNFGM